MTSLKRDSKSLLSLLAVLLLIVTIFLLPQLLKQLYTGKVNHFSRAGGTNAQLCLNSCSAGSIISPINQRFSVRLLADTDGNEIERVDVVLKYDPQMLSLQDINSTPVAETSLKVFTPADNQANLDIQQVRTLAEKTGVIRFSIQANSGSFAGNATLAILTFQPRAFGKTQLSFDFKPGDLADSNLLRVNTGGDVLASVTGLVINITNPSEGKRLLPVANETAGEADGDINGDGRVDVFDYNILLSEIGKTGELGFSRSDINRDGKVDLSDRNLLLDYMKQK